MSVYKQKGSEYYRVDFQCEGRRFLATTEATNKKDALAAEKQLRLKAKEEMALRRKQGDKEPLTFDVAAGRYFKEIGEEHANSRTTFTDLERLLGFFGPTKRLDQITDEDVAALVRWRKAQQVMKRQNGKDGKVVQIPVRQIAPATVNRSTVDLLKALFTRARKVWRYALPLEPLWSEHRLKEPQERVRELYEGEGEALGDAVRDDYADWFEFCRLTGLRRNETLIRWPNVNVFAKSITTIGKGGRKVSTPITPAVKAILDRCKGHHPEFVFTFVCQRPRKGQTKGQRYPITPEGAKTQWRRLRARAKVQDFRFHDIRHDVGTKLLRQTGNLKLVQAALNHANISTTTKYAHVQSEEVAAALQRLAEESPAKSSAIEPKKGYNHV